MLSGVKGELQVISRQVWSHHGGCAGWGLARGGVRAMCEVHSNLHQAPSLKKRTRLPVSQELVATTERVSAVLKQKL